MLCSSCVYYIVVYRLVGRSLFLIEIVTALSTMPAYMFNHPPAAIFRAIFFSFIHNNIE